MMKKLLCSFLFFVFSVTLAYAQAEINVQGNGIDIADGGAGTPNLADGTDFGQVAVSTSSAEQIFVIQNTGTTALTILTSATTNPIFAITTTPATSVPAGGSTNIGITFNAPSTTGITNAQLFIFNTDADENPYEFNLTAEAVTATGPEIDVTGNTISIVGDGTNVPNLADGTDFGQVASGTSSTEQIFVIQNLGSAPLTVNPSFTTNPLFVITTPATSPVPVGGSVNIGVTFNAPTTPGVTNAILFISNGDPDEDPYQINLTAESAAPPSAEINVTGNGISIIGDGSNVPNLANGTDFGQVDVNTSSAEQLFVIENTGTLDLAVSSWFTTNPIFAITTAPTSPVPGGGSTTIGITFNAPAAANVFNEQIFIFNGDSDENPYVINITAESVIPSNPEINVTGNGIAIIGDGTNVPSTADGTDFGQVLVSTSSAEQIFVIENTGTAPLTVNPSFTTNPAFVITTAAVSPVPAGGSTTIGITYNAPATAGITNATLLISNGDSDENPYQINLTAEAIDVTGPEIDIFGNGVEIASGDTTPDVADDTDYGQADITFGNIAHTFTIENNGTSDLTLTDTSPYVRIGGAHPQDFTVTIIPTTPISASGSTTFQITFNPTALGIRTADVSISNDDADEDPYTFSIQGEGIDANADSPLLITQYYEGSGNDQWIEIKNISQQTVIAGSYFLALYTNFNTLIGTINTTAPNESIAIATMLPGAVRIYRNPSATLPSAGNLGSGVITDTNVCTFDGNDVILISTTNDATCYDNRLDIVGVVDAVTPRTWGQDISFIKGCGTTEQPSTTFDATLNQPNPGDVLVNDYIELTLDEVNNAVPTTNIALGDQGIGPTIWDFSWDNGTPDRTRNTIINGTYTAGNGSFETCNFTINGTLDFNSGTSNYIGVHEDLSINGTFNVGDTESLHFDSDNEDAVITGVITKIESSTSLTNILDFTYWSSPVEGATIESVFSNADLSGVYYWDQSAENIIPGGDVGDPTIVLGEWINATGEMRVAKGYISKGPTTGTYPQQHTISFTGSPTNGVKSIAGSPHMVFNNDGNAYSDYNLVGNPYPSALDADLLIGLVDNNTIDGTLWFWTHNTQNNGNPVYQYTTDDYASYNLTGGTAAATGGAVPTNNVGSGQGFMVRAISPSPGLIFNNEMRLKGQNTQFFRTEETKSSVVEEKDRVWLNVESSEGGAFNQILIGFMDKATDGYDRGYDGLKNGASWISFYSKIDSLRYAIQGLGSFSLDKKVTLGFDTYIEQPLSYTISLANIEGVLKDNDMYLVDHLLEVTHDLKQAPYVFDVDGVGNFDERFTLQFTKATLSTDDLDLDSNDFIVIDEENSLNIRSKSIITQLKVYDMLGRLLIDTEPNDSDFNIATHNIRKGTVLILNATFDNGSEMSKKAIKY